MGKRLVGMGIRGGWLQCYSRRQSRLVTYTHLGHSYPIRPGPLPNGGICTTTVMTASHRGQRNSPAGLPSAKSDTPYAYICNDLTGPLG